MVESGGEGGLEAGIPTIVVDVQEECNYQERCKGNVREGASQSGCHLSFNPKHTHIVHPLLSPLTRGFDLRRVSNGLLWWWF